MNVVIFDDDAAFSKKLETAIKQNFIGVNTVLSTGSIKDIHSYILFFDSPALYFLDIMISGHQLGLKLSDEIRQKTPTAIIVFITDYPNKILLNSFYKIKAFNVILKKNPRFDDEIMKSLPRLKWHKALFPLISY